jgi:RimJ/RimL family protein N-acetyltransferase
VALRTPPRGPLLSGMPRAAARALADFFTGDDPSMPGVVGPTGPAGWFAERFGELTGTVPRHGMGQRLFRLDELRAPVGVPGKARRATRADRDQLLAWSAAFGAEATPHDPPADHVTGVDARLRHDGLLWFWEAGGIPVSMAWLSVAVAGVARVSGVYTPPELRGRGYASAAVAAATRHALDTGAKACVLYTDLTNPTSNKIYQALGYRPVAEAQEWRFRAT